MKNIRKYTIVFVLLLQVFVLRGQGAHVSVESLLGFPDTAFYNDSYTFSVFLHNYDSSAFQGYVGIHFRTDSVNGSSGTFIGPFQIFIGPDSFASIPINGFAFDTSFFKMGGNVVVVWPVSSGLPEITMTDTFYTYVHIAGTAGIFDYSSEDAVHIYPVPANDVLFLPQNIAENSIEHLRIIDMLGRTKYYSDKTVTSINTSFFEQGVYFIEIKMKNKTPKVSKFVISR